MDCVDIVCSVVFAIACGCDACSSSNASDVFSSCEVRCQSPVRLPTLR
jgi:hypothetical protein